MGLKTFDHDHLEVTRTPYPLWKGILDFVFAILLGAVLCAIYYGVQIFIL